MVVINMVFFKGDVLRVKRFIYWHYGIYINDNCVIHYSCAPSHWWKVKASIKQASLKDFLGKSVRSEVYYRDIENGEKIAAKAFARLGEKKYSLLLNNCKHLVIYCMSEI